MLQPHIIIRILIAYNPASLRLLRTILRWLKKCQITHKQQGQLNLWLNYPCLCLCLGFSQIILMLPFLLITLHFSQIGLTDVLTFTANPPFSIKVPIYKAFAHFLGTLQKCPYSIIHRHFSKVNNIFIYLSR